MLLPPTFGRYGAVRVLIGLGAVASLSAAAAGQAAAPNSFTPALVISRSHVTGRASFVTGASGAAPIVDRFGRAIVTPRAFINQHGRVFGVTNQNAQLLETRSVIDNIGFATTTYQQLHLGVPVFSGVLKVHQNALGEVIVANGDVYDIPDKVGVAPTLDAQAAEAAARANVLEPHGILEKLELVVVDPGWYGDAPIGPHLAYHIIISRPMHAFRQALFIDAHNGAVLDSWSMIHRIQDREVYDEMGAGSLPGTPARFEGDPATGDFDVDAAYDYLGDAYDYFFNGFGLDGVDGAGMKMIATVDTATVSCPNAYWNGFQSVYCATIAVDDVIGHEITHGVTEFSADLIYQNQSGQLNESFSDVFGEMIDLYNSGSEVAGLTTGTPWTVHGTGPGTDGPNLLRAGSCSDAGNGYSEGYRRLMGEDAVGFGDAIRDMWNPPCKGAPDRNNSDLHKCSLGDSGGVHRGSGVTNHAFAILTDGKTFNGHTVAGLGPIKSGAVWYRALTTYLTAGSDFQDAYWALNQAATDLIGTFPNDPRTGLASASMFTAADAVEVNEALLAVELDEDGNCGAANNVLDSATAPACSTQTPIFSEDFENGSAGWTVSNSTVGTAYDWAVVGGLPYARTGSAMRIANGPASPVGNEAGTHELTSPSIAVPLGVIFPVLEFTHYVEVEREWDGGNVLISVDGAPFEVIDTADYYYNGHNIFAGTSAGGNTNPKEGEPLFTGAGGRWGTSLVSLSSYAVAGASIRIRFEFGKDGNTAYDGWYVDDVKVYDCPNVRDCNNNSVPDEIDFASPSGEVLAWSQLPSTGSAYHDDVDTVDNEVSVRAQRVELMGQTHIESIRIWGGYYPDNHFPIDNFTVRIYDNSAGSYQPGTLVYSQSGVSASRTATGRTAFGVDEIEVSLTLAPAVDLPAGNYWFHIYDDTTGDSDGFIWLGSAYERGLIRAQYAQEAPGVNWIWSGYFHLSLELISDSDGTYCHADVTTQGAGIGDPAYGQQDGQVTGADINYYVNLWITGDLCADVTTQGAGVGDPNFGVPDGLVTGADIQFYVNLWIAGCP